MVKITGPLFSQKATGSIAHSLIFAGAYGGTYAKSYKVPANPRSPAQQLHRLHMSLAVSRWQDMSAEERLAFKTPTLPAYQSFMRSAMENPMSDLITFPKDIFSPIGDRVFIVDPTGTDLERGAALLAAVALANASMPTETDRAVVFVPPGVYGLNHDCILLTITGVDLIGADKHLCRITGDYSQTLDSLIFISVADCNVSGFTLLAKAATSISSNIWHTGKLQDLILNKDVGVGVWAGNYDSILSNGGLFQGSNTVLSGTFINCNGGEGSFGGAASGNFYSCICREAYGFQGNASHGRFIDCISGPCSFDPANTAGHPFFCIGCHAGYSSFGSQAIKFECTVDAVQV